MLIMNNKKIEAATSNNSPKPSRSKMVLLGVIASLALLSTGDTSTSGTRVFGDSDPVCDGTEMLAGGFVSEEYFKTCLKLTDQRGTLSYPNEEPIA